MTRIEKKHRRAQCRRVRRNRFWLCAVAALALTAAGDGARWRVSPRVGVASAQALRGNRPPRQPPALLTMEQVRASVNRRLRRMDERREARLARKAQPRAALDPDRRALLLAELPVPRDPQPLPSLETLERIAAGVE